MKKIKFWVGACCLLALVTLVQISRAQSEPTDVIALKQQFTAEIKSLRVELLQQGISFQEWKIKQLERDLQRLKSERERWEETEMNLRRQLANVEQSIAAGASDEQEGMKAELNSTHLRGVRNKTQPLVEQETELHKQLEQERQQLEALQTKLKQLKAESEVGRRQP